MGSIILVDEDDVLDLGAGAPGLFRDGIATTRDFGLDEPIVGEDTLVYFSSRSCPGTGIRLTEPMVLNFGEVLSSLLLGPAPRPRALAT